MARVETLFRTAIHACPDGLLGTQTCFSQLFSIFGIIDAAHFEKKELKCSTCL